MIKRPGRQKDTESGQNPGNEALKVNLNQRLKLVFKQG